jgi:tetrahydromethanopterin S-methyltransferase subunit A
MSSIKRAVPERAASALHEIARGMALRKCRKCGCMKEALDAASRTFRNAEDSEIRELFPTIEARQTAMEPIAYDCIGCKKCWGADAIIQLANHFEEVAMSECSSDGDRTAKREYISAAINGPLENSWPPYPGEYIVGNPVGSVAICTLSNRELPQKLIAAAGPDLAIAGRCDTENIGIEKVVLNLLANSHIRWLLLCGVEAPGHRAADAFLRLKDRGVDANMRVLESASWRPVLKNLTLFDVARFREQIELVNLIGVTVVDEIVEAAHEAAKKPTAPFTVQTLNNSDKIVSRVQRLQARAPKTLRLDKAGFFVVLPQAATGLIICEHYENSGRLAHVIEGRQAAVIAATLIQEGLVTQLDHAAYVGRELTKAEIALKTGSHYEQDAALGIVSSKKGQGTEPCEDLACSCHGHSLHPRP